MDSYHQPVCELLSKHASRWRDVYFWSDIDSSEYLACAKGNLGRLETLHIASGWTNVDTFKNAPRLTDPDAVTLSRRQIEHIRMLEPPGDPFYTHSFRFPRRPPGHTFYGQLDSVPDIPWPQILTFTYWADAHFNSSKCLTLLSLATNLVAATFFVDLRGIHSDVVWKAASSDVRSITLQLAANN
ncbi:hypothetical protein B0H12DRAFT_1243054 [Mycena haematopus]|nr:hypothetical protein B0H12DRAFT_1243054 [Mycena haematopus]